MNYIHISTARKVMEAPEPFDITVLQKNGEIRRYKNIISLRYNFYKGTRRIKFMTSGEIRQIRDCLILELNGMAVGL